MGEEILSSDAGDGSETGSEGDEESGSRGDEGSGSEEEESDVEGDGEGGEGSSDGSEGGDGSQKEGGGKRGMLSRRTLRRLLQKVCVSW
jgi:hypothetical protein